MTTLGRGASLHQTPKQRWTDRRYKPDGQIPSVQVSSVKNFTDGHTTGGGRRPPRVGGGVPAGVAGRAV